MARKRFISPEFFKHSELYELERSTALPLRLAYAGLWTLCDRRGLFWWKPREMKLDVLPYDDVDFTVVLDALCTGGFIVQYTAANGKLCGQVIAFERWQSFHRNEQPSDVPDPVRIGAKSADGVREPSKGGPEPSKGGPEPSPSTTVAVTTTTTTPVAVAVAVAVAADETTATADALRVLFDDDAARAAFDGYWRASRHPDSLTAELNALNAGERGPPVPWPIIGRALHEMRFAGVDRLTSRTLRAFVRPLLEAPPDPVILSSTDLLSALMTMVQFKTLSHAQQSAWYGANPELENPVR